MDDTTIHHALHCQPSTSGQQQQQSQQQNSHHSQSYSSATTTTQIMRDSESPVSPSGSNASKNTTTTTSSASPLPPHLSSLGQQPQQQHQIFPIRSPSLNTTSITSNNNNSIKKIFSKATSSSTTKATTNREALLSSRAQLLTSSHVQLPSHQRLVQIHSLTKDMLAISVEQKCQVWDIYHCCCTHLGIDDARILGLAIRAPSEGIGSDRPRHEYFFLQNDQKVAKYLPKQSRFSKLSSSDKNRPVLVLYLRVRVFVERMDMIQCQVALHHYYLQLRENLLDQWSGSNSVREERCWELATLAVQADEAEYGTPSQFRAEKYFPLWVINLRGLDYVRKNMPKIVKNPEFKVSSAREAKMQFCQEASRSPFALNCHLYGLRRHKADMTDNALIGINDKGIDMWDVGSNGERIPLRSLPWNKMVRLTFDHKKLTIGGVDNSKMSLYAQSDDKARYILNFCKDVHQQLIQINLHFALNKKPHNALPPGWGNEVCVDNGGRVNRLAALPPIQAPSPISSSQSTSTTPAQNSPASVILPPYARGSSPHPMMRIHQQHSIDSTTAAETPLDSEKNSVKERAGSDTSSATTNTTAELPKKKRSSGGAKARIASSNSTAAVNSATKIGGRYEPHQPNQKHNRISPTYSNASDNTADSGPPSSISNELETYMNNVASPPRYKPSGDEEIIPNGIMTTSTSSTMSALSQKMANSNMSNGIQQQQHQQYDTSGYASSSQQQHHQLTSESAAERRNHFVASRTFDEYPTPIGNSVMEAASRSLHDLRFHQQQQPQQQYQQQYHQQMPPPPPPHPSMPNGYPPVRQPPDYRFALQQLTHHQQHQQPQPQQSQSHRAYPLPPPALNLAAMSQGPLRPSRWPTVNGADPDLMLLIERMQLQHQQYVPTNNSHYASQQQHQPQPHQQHMTPRKQNSMTIEQQQQQFGVHRGVSEPRLNLSVHQNNQQPTQVANLYANNNSSNVVQQQQQQRTPLPHQHSVTSNASSSNNNAQKKRRYASRSPSNRGINRVKSMPAPPSGVFMNDVNGTRCNNSDANGIPASSAHYNNNRQPPPYNHAVQMQHETDAARKNALEKRHSTSGIVDSIHQYPMLHALMQENGGMPSTSTSDDASTTSIISTATTPQSMIPPRDYDRSSLESDTVSIESYRQQQRDGSFTERYAATPPRPSNIIGIQQASSISGSPPSPPFYYTAAGQPLMWNNSASNNNNSNGFSRGEYLIQDNIQSFLASVPHGYRNAAANHAAEIGHRPNGFYHQSQGVVDLPAPPPYPQGSLVM